MRNVQIPNIFHTLAEDRVPNRSKKHEQKKQNVSFSFMGLGGSHCRRVAAEAITRSRMLFRGTPSRNSSFDVSPRHWRRKPRQPFGPFRALSLCARARI